MSRNWTTIVLLALVVSFCAATELELLAEDKHLAVGHTTKIQITSDNPVWFWDQLQEQMLIFGMERADMADSATYKIYVKRDGVPTVDNYDKLFILSPDMVGQYVMLEASLSFRKFFMIITRDSTTATELKIQLQGFTIASFPVVSTPITSETSDYPDFYYYNVKAGFDYKIHAVSISSTVNITLATGVDDYPYVKPQVSGSQVVLQGSVTKDTVLYISVSASDSTDYIMYITKETSPISALQWVLIAGGIIVCVLFVFALVAIITVVFRRVRKPKATIGSDVEEGEAVPIYSYEQKQVQEGDSVNQ
jgi:hypothetical protein